jgi:tetratricopeptide (TPR) repeat protein
MGVLLLLATVLAVPAQTASPAQKPGQAEAYYLFLEARRLEGEGKADEAIAALRKAADIDPGAAEIRVELASLFARQNRAADALREAEAALAIDAANRQAHRVLGSIYAAASEPRERPGGAAPDALGKAIQHFEAARPERGIDVGLEFGLGRLYVRAGQYDKAIDALTRFAQEQPGVPEAAMILADAYAGAGKLAEAAKTLESAVDDDPGFYRGLLRLAQIYEELGRWSDASAAYERASTLNPRSAELRNQRAIALLNSGSAAAARDLLRTAAAADPPDPTTLYLFAQAARAAGDPDAAETAARRLMTAAPADPRGPYALALVLDRRRDYRQEVAVLEAALAKTPSGGRAPMLTALQAQLAFAYQSLGESAKALAAIDAATTANPQDVDLKFQRASLLERANRFGEAEQGFRSVIANDPLHAPALNYLGYMLADRGERLDEAVTLIKRALEVDPDNPSYLDSLGWAYFKQDRIDLADPPLAQAAEQLKTSSVVQDHLGDLRLRQKRYGDAVEAWTRALAGDGESINRATIEKKIQDAKRRQ